MTLCKNYNLSALDSKGKHSFDEKESKREDE